MNNLHTASLYIHIASGTVAFIAAPIALIVKKGANTHRLFGKIYFWAMAIVALSATVLSVLRENIFLFCVAFFAFYLVASGYRWLWRKNQNKKPERLDWLIHITAAVFNAGLLVIGIMRWIENSTDAFGYISATFGLIGLNFCRFNIKQLRKPSGEKAAWLYNHLGGMIGGYIATVSAFSAVNMHFLPAIIQWLWPTIIGTPVIFLFIRYYRRKISGGKKPEELVEVRI
jgi:uncharacterized membrane protein